MRRTGEAAAGECRNVREAKLPSLLFTPSPLRALPRTGHEFGPAHWKCVYGCVRASPTLQRKDGGSTIWTESGVPTTWEIRFWRITTSPPEYAYYTRIRLNFRHSTSDNAYTQRVPRISHLGLPYTSLLPCSPQNGRRGISAVEYGVWSRSRL